MGDETLGLVLIDAADFMLKLGLRSESGFHELRKRDPRFPKTIKRGRRYSRWVLSEADCYIRLLIAERDAGQGDPKAVAMSA